MSALGRAIGAALGRAMGSIASLPWAGAISALFGRDFSTSPALGNNATYTCATARTIVDHEGVLRTIPAGCFPVDNARLVVNELANISGANSEDLTTAATQTNVILTSGTMTATARFGQFRHSMSTAENGQYIISAEIKLLSGTAGDLYFIHVNSADGNYTVIPAATDEWVRVSASVAGRVGGGSTGFGFSDYSLSDWATYGVRNFQIEDATGRADTTTPSKYVSVGVGTGAELVTNGTFDADTDWSHSTPWEITGGEAVSDGTNGATISQIVDIIEGKTYEVSFDVTARTAGSVRVRLGGATNNDFGAYSAGSYSEILTAEGTDSYARLVAYSSFAGAVDNFSIKLCDPGDVGVDGYKYFATENGNSVDGNGVVTPGTGTALTGIVYSYQPLDINIADYSEDPTGVHWFESGVCTVTAAGSTIAGIPAWELSGQTAKWHRRYISTAAAQTGRKYISIYCASGNQTNIRITFRNETVGPTDLPWDITIGDTSPTPPVNATVGTVGFARLETVDNGYRYVLWCEPATDTDSMRYGVGVGTATATDTVLVTGAQVSDTPGAYIPTVDTDSVQRNASELSYTQTTPQTEGMLIVKVRQHYLSTGTADGTVVSTQSAGESWLHHDNNSDSVKMWDGASNKERSLGAYTISEPIYLAVRWTGSVRQIGSKITGGSWGWRAEDTYSGTWPTDGVIRIGGVDAPESYDLIAVYDKDKGTDWIEGNYP